MDDSGALPKSMYRGVEWDANLKKWRPRITIMRRKISLGSFACQEEAAMAYNEAALLRGVPFPRYNRGLGDVDVCSNPPVYTGRSFIKPATRAKLMSVIAGDVLPAAADMKESTHTDADSEGHYMQISSHTCIGPADQPPPPTPSAAPVPWDVNISGTATDTTRGTSSTSASLKRKHEDMALRGLDACRSPVRAGQHTKLVLDVSDQGMERPAAEAYAEAAEAAAGGVVHGTGTDAPSMVQTGGATRAAIAAGDHDGRQQQQQEQEQSQPVLEQLRLLQQREDREERLIRQRVKCRPRSSSAALAALPDTQAQLISSLETPAHLAALHSLHALLCLGKVFSECGTTSAEVPGPGATLMSPAATTTTTELGPAESRPGMLPPPAPPALLPGPLAAAGTPSPVPPYDPTPTPAASAPLPAPSAPQAPPPSLPQAAPAASAATQAQLADVLAAGAPPPPAATLYPDAHQALQHLSLADIQRLSPATAAALQERLDAGRPELLQQVLDSLQCMVCTSA